MIVLFTLNIKRFPAVPAMFVGATVAVLVAIFVQKASMHDALLSLNYGYSGDTGVAVVDDLLNRGGIQSMMWTFSLAFIAISLGGVLERVGFLNSLVKGFIHKVNSPGTLALVVMISTTIGTAAMGEIYLSLILNGNLYKEVFKEKGIESSMLSRYLEEGGTLTQVFIPWSTGAAFMASTLGVSAFQYAPYAFLNYINPIMSLVLSFFGIFVFRTNKEAKGSLQ